ncbi:MAG: hypothetical protein ACK40A_05760 [Pannonibacter indicus]
MTTRRLLFLTGTRADFGKLEPLAIAARDAGHEVTFFVTGMHMLEKYGLTRNEVQRLPGVVKHEFINQRLGDPQDIILSKTILGLSDWVHENRPDLTIVPFRGNVGTRLQKLLDGVADATMLAMAGLNRLGEGHRATALLDPEIFMPAPAQGAIGIAVRSDDARTAGLVAALNHAQTHLAITAERAMLAVLDGSCRTPVGALSRLDNGVLTLKGQILSLDGKTAFDSAATGSDPEALGRQVGEDLIAQAGTEWLAQWARL